MSRFMLGLALGIGLAPLALQAQDANPLNPVKPLRSIGPFHGSASALELTATPEMWFYEQERRRYEDPNAMARARAALQTDQRAARLNALRWFGYSNSRPRAGTDPVNGSYAPRWVGNGNLRNEWQGVNGAGGATIGGILIYDRARRY